jgi:hypothetical protein
MLSMHKQNAHAYEHAVKTKIFELNFKFFKTSKKYPNSKGFKKSCWKLANGFKLQRQPRQQSEIFIFYPALKKKKLACTNSNLLRKNFEIMTRMNNFEFWITVSNYSWRLYGIKITRIHEIENVTLGHL